MNRRKFITKNQVKIHSYVYVVAVICVLLILFLIIGNATSFVSAAKLDESSQTEEKIEKNLSRDVNEQQADVEENEEKLTSLNSDTKIFLLGSGDAYEAVKNQLLIEKQNAAEIDDIDDSVKKGSLLIMSEDSISDSSLKTLKKLVKNGVNLLFLEIPDNIMSSESLQDLMGIESITERETFKGMRMSKEFYAGTWMENTKEKVKAYYAKVGRNTKTYMCALPKNYEEIEDNDLPALVWRYIENDGYGSVYVCNGNFMDSEDAYGIIPTVLQELNGSYIYPIINAYCVFAEGVPYSGEEERDYWQRLYSRNESGILSDLIMPQLVRYSKTYDAKLTAFTRERDLFLSTDDDQLSYYTRMIESNQGILGLKTDSGDYLKSEDDPVCIEAWEPSYSLWDKENKKLEIPVNYVYNTSNTDTLPSVFEVTGSSYGLGYYALSIDYEDFLKYDGEDDIWQEFCSELEVILGTHEESVGWMERVTASEAANRMYSLLNMDLNCEYGDNGIKIQISNFDNEAWFILRDRHENYTCSGCTVESIGTYCYLVTVTNSTAQITWSDQQ